MDWKNLDWTTKAAKSFYREAIEYGVGNQGYTIPMRGPNGQFALFTISDSCEDQKWQDFIGEYARDFMVIATSLTSAHCALKAAKN